MATTVIPFAVAATYTWTCHERGVAAVLADLTGCTMTLSLRRQGSTTLLSLPLAKSGTPVDGTVTLTVALADFTAAKLAQGSTWDMRVVATPKPAASITGIYPDGAWDTLEVGA